MSKTTRDIPFTEIVEIVQDLSKSNSKDERRIRGVVNRKYAKAIPRENDWPFLKSTSGLTTVAEYKSGTVTIQPGSTQCTFSSVVSLDASFTGRKIKFTNNSNEYPFTFTDTTGGTISPGLSGNTTITGGAYRIYGFQYSLAPDFDRFPINGGLLYWSGGQPTPLPEREDDDYYNEYTASPTSNPDFCRLQGYDTAGNRRVEIVPPLNTIIFASYEYIKALSPMIETTAGTVAVTGTVVTGTGTKFTQATTGDYFRIDVMGVGNDSEWYKIDTITHDSALILVTSVVSNNGAGTSYTISSFPYYPPSLQEALIPGSMRDIIIDQNDPNFLFYHSEYARILTDNKVLIQNRKAKDDIELIAEDINYRR